MHSNDLIKKYTEQILLEQSNANFLKITKLNNNLGYEEILFILGKSDTEPQTTTSLDYESIFNNKYGISTVNKKILGTLNNYNKLKNDFIEVVLFDFNKILYCDGITNINLKLNFINQFASLNNPLIELVFKINFISVNSQVFETPNNIYFIRHPNIIITTGSNIKGMQLCLHCKEHTFNCIKNDIQIELEYEEIFFNLNSRDKIIKDVITKSYNFILSNGVIITCLKRFYNIRFFTQFIDIVHPNFKFLYSTELLTGNSNNNLENNFVVNI